MLRELGAVSEDAKREAAAPAAAAPPPLEPAVDSIEKLVGELTTPQMALETKPDPPLLNDRTSIVPILQDQALNASGSDIGILSTESVFDLYQRSLPSAAPPPAAAEAPAVESQPSPAASGPPAASAPPPPPPAAAPAAAPASERPAPPRGAPGPSASATPATQGPLRGVALSSDPAGASAVFDEGKPNAISCTTPCNLSLSADRHTYLVTLAGYRDRRGIIDAGRKSESISLALEARRGQLMVESKNSDARWPIFLNGRNTGQRTPSSFMLSEGDYEVGVEIEGKVVTEKVSIADFGIQRLSF
jgi:hypothetical protein